MLKVWQLNKNFYYREKPAIHLLQSYIMYFWELKSRDISRYTVVPDACVDFIINCNSHDGFLISPSPTEAINFEIDQQSLWFGIRFKPMVIYSLFGFPVSELKGNTVYLNEIKVQFFKELNKNILTRKTFEERVQAFESFLLNHLKNIRVEFDYRLLDSLEVIYKSYGTKRVENEVASTVSPRQLRRLFQEQIGLSPKDFCRIIRFQSLMNIYARKNRDIHHLNYYDQAHFIHDIRKMSGLSPSQLLQFL